MTVPRNDDREPHLRRCPLDPELSRRLKERASAARRAADAAHHRAQRSQAEAERAKQRVEELRRNARATDERPFPSGSA